MLKLVLFLTTTAVLSAHTVIYLHDPAMPTLPFPSDVTVTVIEYRGLDVSAVEILHALKAGNADLVAQGEAKQIGCALAMGYEVRQCLAVDVWSQGEAQEKLSGWNLYQAKMAWAKAVRYAGWKYYDLRLYLMR